MENQNEQDWKIPTEEENAALQNDEGAALAEVLTPVFLPFDPTADRKRKADKKESE